MDLSRVRRYEWTSAALGLGLLAAMFLDWYGAGAAMDNAWQALSIVDLVLALAAALAISLVPATGAQRAAALAQALAAFATIAAGIALLLVVYRTLRIPAPYVSREAGLWLALALTTALTLSTWRSMADQRFPKSLQTRTEIPRLPAPAPEGAARRSQ